MILVINPGSSSLKYKLFDNNLKNIIESEEALSEKSDIETVVNKIIKDLDQYISDIEKIAIRVVHGGPNFEEVAVINDEVLSEIKKYSAFAPLHNPQSLAIINALLQKFGQYKIFVVLDTGYFNSLPLESKIYPLGHIDTPLKIQRYGFHGISHKFMCESIDSAAEKKIITVHLGAGCSVSAIDKGNVIATSMGLTPDEGLVMQTRSGDLDPGLILYLVSEFGLDKTRRLIEKEAGLAGLTETSGNMLDILDLAGEEISEIDYSTKYEKSDENVKKAQLALRIYINKIVHYIGGYSALMGGVDTIVFSGKIGAGSPVIRQKVLNHLKFLGDIEIKIVKTDEELAMAKEVSKLQSN